MPKPNWRAITLSSLGVAAIVAYRREQWEKLPIWNNFALAYLAQLLCFVVYSVFIYPKWLSPLRHLPQPKNNHWLLGQFKLIAQLPSGVPMTHWANEVPHDGIIRYLGLFNQERLLILSPKALGEVLTTHSYHFKKPSGLRFSLGRILGDGILLAEGDVHKMQRKNLTPAFAFRHVKNLYPLFWSKSVQGIQALTAQVRELGQANGDVEKAGDNVDNAPVIEVSGWTSRITLDIIGLAALGKDFGAISNPDNELSITYGRVFKPSKQAMQLGVLEMFLPSSVVSALPFKRNELMSHASALIRGVCRDVIREKREKLDRKQLQDLDVLSVALESGGFSEENLVDQMMTFLAAGHETTATSMTWAIYMLCLNPDVQKRLREEVRQHLPSPDSDQHAEVTSLIVDHMPYLNAVCNEVLRYFSPVPMTLRETDSDTIIDGHRIPKGTRIILCPWATNKDESQWGPDASRFDPDRWMPKSEGDRSAASGGAVSNYSLMTFLHGPRSCIGQRFAKGEFACLLASWIGRFEFSLKNKEEYDEKNLDIKAGIVARPANGLHVHARIVEGW